MGISRTVEQTNPVNVEQSNLELRDVVSDEPTFPMPLM